MGGRELSDRPHPGLGHAPVLFGILRRQDAKGLLDLLPRFPAVPPALLERVANDGEVGGRRLRGALALESVAAHASGEAQRAGRVAAPGSRVQPAHQQLRAACEAQGIVRLQRRDEAKDAREQNFLGNALARTSFHRLSRKERSGPPGAVLGLSPMRRAKQRGSGTFFSMSGGGLAFEIGAFLSGATGRPPPGTAGGWIHS